MVDSKEGSREKVNRRGLTEAGKGRCDSIWGRRFQEREEQVQDRGRRHVAAATWPSRCAQGRTRRNR